MLYSIPLHKSLLLFIFCLSFNLQGFSQSNTENIAVFRNIENSNKARIQSLLKVNWDSISMSKDTGDLLLAQGIDLCKSMGDTKSMCTLILVHTEKVNNLTKKGMDYVNTLLSTSKKNGWDSFQVAGYYWKGRKLGMREEIAQAIEVLNEIINHEDKIIEKYHVLHGMIYEELALLQESFGNYQGSLEMHQHSLKINEKHNNLAGVCSNLININRSYLFTHEMEPFKSNSQRAIHIAKSINRKDLEYKVYLNLASKFGFHEMYDSCLIYALKGENLSFKNIDKFSQAQMSDIIAACYLNLGQQKKALTYQLQAYEITNENHYKNRIALNVGLVYIAMEEYSNALVYYDSALIYAIKTESDAEKANVLNHMGYLNLKREKYNLALANFNAAKEKLTESNNLYLKNENYRGLAKVHQKLGNSKISNGYIDKALLSDNSHTQLSNLYLIQAKNFEKLQSYKNAYLAYQKHNQYKDSLTTKSNKEIENKILAQYSVEKAENELKITKIQKEVSDLNVEKQRRMKIFGFCLLALSLISIIIIISRNKKFLAEREKARKLEKESALAIIQNSQKALASQSELILNKNRLIEELKNNLNLLFNESSVDLTGMNNFLDSKILTKEDWNKFKAAFTVVYPEFIQNATEKYPNLTAGELRLLCLLKLGLTIEESADMLGVLPNSVRRTSNRILHKYDMSNSLSIQDLVERINT